MSAMDATDSVKADSEPCASQLCVTDSQLMDNSDVLQAAQTLSLRVVAADQLDVCLSGNRRHTVFLLRQFEGDIFCKLKTAGALIMGVPALLSTARGGGSMPSLFHPLYCTAMSGVALCFTGFRTRHKLKRLVDLAHYMGGSVRREMGMNVTHVVANCCSGVKYRYAVAFGVPALQYTWIETVWQQRDDPELNATTKQMVEPHRLRPFCGARVRFVGFPADESHHMRELLLNNGGAVYEDAPTTDMQEADGSDCVDNHRQSAVSEPTHVVVDDSAVGEPSAELAGVERAHVVRAEWFWASIQMDEAADETLYPFKSQQQHQVREASSADLLAPTNLTPKSRSVRKRKRLRATVQQLALSPGSITSPPLQYGGSKRRSSVTDINLLSTSGSFLDATAGADTDDSTFADYRLRLCPAEFNPRLSDVFENPVSPLMVLSSPSLHTPPPPSTSNCSTVSGTDVYSPAGVALSGVVSPAVSELSAMSPRQQVFNELLQTEINYVKVLQTIVTFFKEPLEVSEQTGGPLLEVQDIKTIFGNIPPILDVHTRMREDFERMASQWKDELSIGQVIMRHSDQLMLAYPSFINYFERSKETLTRLDSQRPRFHAFLKINQSRAECGRQRLQELLIRPVQRLPSIILLLNDLLKHTHKSLLDHQALNQAVARIKEVMTHINEDKRRTEAQMALFNIFNDIENCPPHLVSSHRTYVTRCDVVEIKGDGLSGRGDHLAMFLFSDILEVCKKRARYNSLRSPSTVSLAAAAARSSKPHKHVVLIPLAHIKRVVDIRETDDCHNVFTLICRSNQELKERHYTFTISSDDIVKDHFLRLLCRQMAHVTCRADAENFLTQLDPQYLEIETSDVSMNSTLSRVSRFASKTSRKVGRAFSFKQTPNKLRRAVSTVISPFQSSAGGSGLSAAGNNSCTPLATAASTLNLMETDSSTPVSSGFNGCSTMPHPRTTTTPRSSKKFKASSLGFSTARMH